MDWEKLRHEYITTDTSYAKLGKKYNIAKQQIGRVGVRDGWVQARDEYVAKMLTKTIEIQAEDAAREIANAACGEVTRARVLKEIAAIAFAKGTDYASIRHEEDGRLKVDFANTDDLTEEQKAAITCIELTQSGLRVRTADKLKALEMLAKYTGLIDGAEEAENDTGVIVLPETE